MPAFESVLPRELRVTQGAVPDSATSLTTAQCDVYRIALTNTTASPITFTLTDTAGNVIGNFNAVPIAANIPYDYEFRVPARAEGLKWSAGGVGLLGNVYVRRKTGWSMTNGVVTDTSS